MPRDFGGRRVTVHGLWGCCGGPAWSLVASGRIEGLLYLMEEESVDEDSWVLAGKVLGPPTAPTGGPLRIRTSRAARAYHPILRGCRSAPTVQSARHRCRLLLPLCSHTLYIPQFSVLRMQFKCCCPV